VSAASIRPLPRGQLRLEVEETLCDHLVRVETWELYRDLKTGKVRRMRRVG
jgi:hypothetical protein